MSSSSSIDVEVVCHLKKRRTLGPRGSAAEATTVTSNPRPRGTVAASMGRPGMSSGASSSNIGTTPNTNMPGKATPKPAAAAASMPGPSSGPDTPVQPEPIPQLELIPPQERYPTAPNYVEWWETFKPDASWWPPRPSEPDSIMRQMKRELARTMPRPPVLDAEIMVYEDRSCLGRGAAVRLAGGSGSQAYGAVQREVDRIYAVNRSNELMHDPPYLDGPPLRRGQAGIGFR